MSDQIDKDQVPMDTPVADTLDLVEITLGYAASAAAPGVLKKPNESIVMTAVAGELHFVSRKVFNVLLYHAQQQGLATKETFSIPVRLLQSDAGLGDGNYSMLRARLRGLASTSVECGWMATGKVAQAALQPTPPAQAILSDKKASSLAPVWGVTTLMADANFIESPTTGELTVTWSYSTTLKRLLLEASEYTRLEIAILSKLATLPSLVLYELGARYKTLKEGGSKTFTWQHWYALLRGKPLEASSTLDYRRFKKETLKPSVAQVNRVQNEFVIEFIESKTAAKVTHLQLKVHAVSGRNASKYQPDTQLRASMDMALFNRMLKLGIHQYSADSIYGSCDEGTLEKALTSVESRIGQRHLPAVTSVEAYLKGCIRKLVQAHPSGIARANKTATSLYPRNEAPLTDKVTGPASLTRELPRFQAEYERYHIGLAKQMYQEALPAQKAQWESQFFQERVLTADSSLRKAFDKTGLKSPMVSSIFYLWLAKVTWTFTLTDFELCAFAAERGLLKATANSPG